MKEHTKTQKRISLAMIFTMLTTLLLTAVMLPNLRPMRAEAVKDTYNIFVQGIQVTSANKGDVTGGTTAAKFTYDPDNQTLHVTKRGTQDPVLYTVGSGGSGDCVVRTYLQSLTLSIDCDYVKFISNNDSGDYANDPIHIDGNLSIKGGGRLDIESISNRCIEADSFSVYDTEVHFKGNAAIGPYNDFIRSVNISNSTIVTDLKGYFVEKFRYSYRDFSWTTFNYENYYSELSMNKCHISDPVDGFIELDRNYQTEYLDRNHNSYYNACDYYVVNTQGKKMNKFTISPDAPPITIYDGLKVYGKEVTSANKDDILGGGEFSYDPDKKELYVKKSLETSKEIKIIENTGIDGLTINATGTNCVLSNYYDGTATPCIDISQNTTFTGNKLTVRSVTYGIKVNGSAELNINNPLKIIADYYGIFGSSSASVAFNVSDINVYSNEKIAAVKGFQDIIIPDSLTLYSLPYYISNGIREGQTATSPYAASIYTVDNKKFDLWVNGIQIRTTNKNDILGDGDGTECSGSMYFYQSSPLNILVLNGRGKTLNVNSISSSMRNFYVVVMSETTLRPSNLTSGQINFWTDTQIEGTGKLTVNNICVTDADLTISNMNNLQIGEGASNASSFLAADGTGNIYIKNSNVVVNKVLRTEYGYITLDSCYLAGPQNAEIKPYTGSNYTVKNAVCIGESLAYGAKICKDGTQPQFTNNSMTLGGSISLNFYADLSTLPSTRYADSYVEFEVCGKKQTAKFDPNKMNSTKTTYGFTCMLDAVSMADPVKATLYYYDNKGKLNSITTTSTAESYLEKFNSNDPSKLWELIKSVNDYGYYMQRYLCKHSGSPWTLGIDHLAMKKAYASVADYQNVKNTYIAQLTDYKKAYNYNADIKKVNYSLALDADTSLIFKIKPADNYKGKVTVTVDGKAAKATKLSDGRYQVTVNNIAAHQLGDTHTVAIKTTKGTSTFEASALSYAYECVTDPTDDSELYAMCALYKYYTAAIYYKS